MQFKLQGSGTIKSLPTGVANLLFQFEILSPPVVAMSNMEDWAFEAFADDEIDEYIYQLISDSSMDVENVFQRQWGGSRPGKAPNIDRNFQEGYSRIFKDYFAPHPTYNDSQSKH